MDPPGQGTLQDGGRQWAVDSNFPGGASAPQEALGSFDYRRIDHFAVQGKSTFSAGLVGCEGFHHPQRLGGTLEIGPREGGGFFVAPDARPDDGILHYASIEQTSRLMMFRLLPEVMNGKHGRFKQVRMGNLKKMELIADRPLPIHMDGEIFAGYGMDVRNLTISLLPGDLEISA